MTYRTYFLILCLVTAFPIHAERYSSNGEAFFVGGMQGLFIMLIFGVCRLIKGSISKAKKTQSQESENATSKVVQPSLSAWENFKEENIEIIKVLTKEDLQYLSEKDLLEKVATFKRMSEQYNCSISELKDVTVNIFISKFNIEELQEVINRLTVKSEIESRKYCISEANTMSYYTQIWLSDYLYNKSTAQ